MGAVGHDSADLGGGQHHGVRADVSQKGLGRCGIAQIEAVATAGDHLVAFGGEATHHCRADEPAVARDKYAGAGS